MDIKDVSVIEFMFMPIVPFVTMNIHHCNGDVSLVKGFMLADVTCKKRQDFIVILYGINIIILTIVTFISSVNIVTIIIITIDITIFIIIILVIVVS